MKIVITSIILSFTVSFSIKAQNLGVTRITDDVIVLHPKEADNLIIVQEVGANMTAVRTDSGIIVVDTFVSLEAAKMARDSIKLYFPDIPIKYVINTHHHAQTV